MEDSFRSRDGFRDFLESVITLPILLMRFSVLEPFLRSRRDGLANDDDIDGDSSLFLVCFLHSITRSLNGCITPSNALKIKIKQLIAKDVELVVLVVPAFKQLVARNAGKLIYLALVACE